MAHGTVYACQGAHANESPFSRLFRREDAQYDSHAVALLAGSQGPMMASGGPGSGKPPLPSGFTFFGQFVDHDLTEFRAVQNMRQLPQNPELGARQVVAPQAGVTATNGRTALFDLDAVYGLLGTPEPALFDAAGLFLLGADTRTVGNTTAPRDIVRNADFRDGRLIADPRNDENKLILQLHTLFMRLHNLVHSANSGADPDPVGSAEFLASMATVQAAYRRIVLLDYLPRLVRQVDLQAVVARIQAKTSFFHDMDRRVRDAQACQPGQVAMPVEFAQAVFRLGHSQLRAGYRLKTGTQRPLFQAGGGDLRGREAIVASTELDWKLFFGNGAQAGEPLDTALPPAVFRLPPPAVDAPPVSLAERNIRRGADFGLCSGQGAAISLALRYPHVGDPLSPAELALGNEVLGVDPTLAVQTPLWFYILREAEVRNPGGPELGPVGGLIVAETLLGSLNHSGFDITPVLGATASDNIPPSPITPENVSSMVGLLRLLGEV